MISRADDATNRILEVLRVPYPIDLSYGVGTKAELAGSPISWARSTWDRPRHVWQMDGYEPSRNVLAATKQ